VVVEQLAGVATRHLEVGQCPDALGKLLRVGWVARRVQEHGRLLASVVHGEEELLAELDRRGLSRPDPRGHSGALVDLGLDLDGVDLFAVVVVESPPRTDEPSISALGVDPPHLVTGMNSERSRLRARSARRARVVLASGDVTLGMVATTDLHGESFPSVLSSATGRDEAGQIPHPHLPLELFDDRFLGDLALLDEVVKDQEPLPLIAHLSPLEPERGELVERALELAVSGDGVLERDVALVDPRRALVRARTLLEDSVGVVENLFVHRASVQDLGAADLDAGGGVVLRVDVHESFPSVRWRLS